MALKMLSINPDKFVATIGDFLTNQPSEFWIAIEDQIYDVLDDVPGAEENIIKLLGLDVYEINHTA